MGVLLFLLHGRSLDDCVMRVKPVLQRLDQSPLAVGDSVSKEHSDVAVASKVSLADRLD